MSTSPALPPAACADVVIECGVAAAMRDGCKLVADIYRPVPTAASPGPWPVLLMRQPYGRDIASTVVYAHPTWYARRGFLVVIQDVRGRGDSEGEFYTFRHETDDGFDTVAWAAALPGSNGRVGMYGFSYQGSTQLLAALARPPALRALAPHMTAFDLYSGWFYRSGLLQLSTTLGWASQMLREDSRRSSHPDAPAAERALDQNFLNSGALANAFPLPAATPFTHPALPTYGADWLTHSAYDAYWREFDLLARVADLGLPMFHLSGWYDFYLRGSVDGYRATAAAHPNQFLLAGPWSHIPWGRQIGAADLGPAAVPAIDELQAAWFHHWLDHETPAAPAPLSGTCYFVLGENKWRTAPSWPPATTTTPWYLASDGRANSRFGDGRLDPATASGPDDMFNYDPEVPVAAPGGNQGGHVGWGPHELSAQQQSLNLLCYTSAPLSSPLVIAGHAQLILHALSSAPETSFVARLSRVTPDGRAHFLTLGATIARVQTEPGEITLELDPTAVRFEAGDCLRIDVASSAFPLLVRHPNTLASPASITRPAEFRRALQVVYHDSARPSRILLPVLA